MNLLSLNKKERLRHLFTWLFIFLYEFISSPVNGHLFFKTVGCLFSVANFAILYYSLFCFILPNTWSNRKYLLIPAGIGLFLIYFSIKWATGNFYIHFVGVEPGPGRFLRFIKTSFLFFVPISLMAFSAFNTRLAIEKLRKENEREKARLYDELDFLKSQFNSHLTFNFLNFIYSKALKSSEKAADAIGYFSDMLRYSLRINPQKEVGLEKELESLSNFADLQKCLDEQVCMEISHTGELGGITILPRILISFVEQAFREGIVNDFTHPVQVKLHVVTGSLIFEVWYVGLDNYKQDKGTEEQHLKKYLDVYYGNNHRLEITEEKPYRINRLSLNI